MKCFGTFRKIKNIVVYISFKFTDTITSVILNY